MIPTLRIVEVMTPMRFDWPHRMFTGPFGRQIQGASLQGLLGGKYEGRKGALAVFTALLL